MREVVIPNKRELGKTGRWAIIFVPFFLLAIGGLLWRKHRPVAVQAADLAIGIVQQGTLKASVAAHGEIEPAELISIASVAGGTISKISAYAGQSVNSGDSLMVLSNSDIARKLEDSRERLLNLQSNSLSDSFKEEQEIQQKKSELADNKDALDLDLYKLKGNEALYAKHIVPEVAYRQALLQVSADRRRLRRAQFELERLEAIHRTKEDSREKLATMARKQVETDQANVDALTIKAPVKGVVYSVAEALNVGSNISPGNQILKFFSSNDLNAVLKVDVSDAERISIGQRVLISGDAVKAEGSVIRIDPQVVQDQVAVTARLAQDATRAARPGQPVNGRILVGQLEHVVFAPKPVGAIPNSSREIFVLNAEGTMARRTKLTFGPVEGQYVVIDQGVAPGARVVLSGLEGVGDVDTVLIEK